MNNIDVRKYIINNFKNNSFEEIKNTIIESISKKDDDTLIGTGVLFELMWENSNEEEKNIIINNIKKGI